MIAAQRRSAVCGYTQRVPTCVMSCNLDHSKHSAEWRYANSKHWTPNSKLQTVTLNQITIHSDHVLCIWFSLLHPYMSYCLYCSHSRICSVTPVPLTLLSHTCSIPNVPHYDPSISSHVCLAWNYKVPVSCNYSAVRISKSSGSNSCHYSCPCPSHLTPNLTPKPQTYVQNT